MNALLVLLAAAVFVLAYVDMAAFRTAYGTLLAAVALREVREETGLHALQPVLTRPLSLEILGVPPHIRRGAFVSAHLHLNLTYLFTADSTAPLRVKPDENSAVAWFPAGKAADRSTEPEMQVVYRKLIGRTAAIFAQEAPQ